MLISPNTSPTSRPLSRPTHQAPGPPEVCHGDCHCHNTCVSKGLFNLHGPPRQGAIWRVHVFKRSCSHFSQVCHAEGTRAHTDTKEGKTQANHGFCRGFSILLAEIGSGCAHRFHQSHITDDLVSSLCWFAAGWVLLPLLLLLLLLLRCAVLLALVGYYCWLTVGLVLFCCWLAACCCLLLPLPLPALQSLLICCWLLLHKPYHCGCVVNWAWKA